MGTSETGFKTDLKLKRKNHPVGRLGAHIKHGMRATYSAFFLEYDKAGLPRVGEASIRP